MRERDARMDTRRRLRDARKKSRSKPGVAHEASADTVVLSSPVGAADDKEPDAFAKMQKALEPFCGDLIVDLT